MGKSVVSIYTLANPMKCAHRTEDHSVLLSDCVEYTFSLYCTVFIMQLHLGGPLCVYSVSALVVERWEPGPRASLLSG